MPFFSNKFSVKSIPVRRVDTNVLQREFGNEFAAKQLAIECPPLTLTLGDLEAAFQDGIWIPASGKAGAVQKENIRLKKELQNLEEENNMLRLKFELLLDFATDRAAGDGDQPQEKKTRKHRST